MIAKNKILELIISLISDLESDWQEKMEQINIWEDVMQIYDSPGVSGNQRLGNEILAFTVMAYDNQSEWLEPHKDRWENKKKIMVRIAGISCFSKPIYNLI